MKRIPSSAALAAACALAAPPSYAADASLQTYVQIYTSDAHSVYRSGTDSASATLDRDGLHAEATAQASYGSVAVHALATAAPDQRDLAIAAVAGAAMEDTFFIRVDPVPLPPPGFPGPYTTSVLATVIVTGDPALAQLRLAMGGTSSDVILHGGVNELRFSLVAQPIRIAFSVLADTGSVGGPYQRVSDAAAGIRWGGISEVRLDPLFGQLQFTTASVSGYNWAVAAPIPEPPLLAMMAAGLLSIAWRARTCRSRLRVGRHPTGVS